MDSGSPIILYDGICALCNFWVRFVLRRDRQGIFHFAALQSEAAQSFLQQHEVSADIDSIVLLDSGKAYLRSDAVARILERMGSPLRIVRWIPRPLRDALYRLVAASRYRLFGRYESCPLPDPEYRSRFLA